MQLEYLRRRSAINGRANTQAPRSFEWGACGSSTPLFLNLIEEVLPSCLKIRQGQPFWMNTSVGI